MKPFGAGPYTIFRQVTYYSFELDVCDAVTDPFGHVFHASLLNLYVNRSNSISPQPRVTASSTLSVNSSPSPSPPLPPQPWAEEFKHFNTGDEEYISSKDSDPMIDAYVTFDEPVFTEIYSSSSQPHVW